MRFVRDQRGQTAAEYLGVILIVAALLAAIAAADIGGALTEKLEAAICRVASADEAGCEPQDGAGAPSTGPAGEDPAGQDGGSPSSDAPAPDLDPETIPAVGPAGRTIPVSLDDAGGAPPGYDCFEPYVDPEETPTVPLSPCQREFETERDGGEYIETPEEYERALDEFPFPFDFLAPRSPLDFIPGGKGFTTGPKLLKELGEALRKIFQRRPKKVDPGDAAKKLKEKRAKQVKENKKAGDDAADGIARRTPGSRREVTLDTPLGKRRIDVLTPDGRAIESKVGRTSLSKDVEKQLAKDVRLRNQGEDVRDLEWRFGRSPRTGKCGPTKPLRRALEKADIDIVENC